MNDNSNTGFLYHYTSVDILALILKNRTFRLNPLDKLDDLQEQKTADVNNLGKFVFVSSWTDDLEESIPMWKMYTNPLAGVRIKLRKNPFKIHGTSGSDFSDKMGFTMVDSASSNNHVDTFLNIAEILSKGFYCDQAWNGDILKQVIYTDDKSLLEPDVLGIADGKLDLKLGKLGIHKSKYWEFQKEWRYIMRFVPFNLSVGIDKSIEAFNLTANKMALGIQAPPFPYYDLEIATDAFTEMEITCSPQISVGNRLILDTLVEHFNPDAFVRESALSGKL